MMKQFLLSLVCVCGSLILADHASAQGLGVNGYGIYYPYNPYYLSPTYYGYNYGPRFNTNAPGPPNSGWPGRSGPGGFHGCGGDKHYWGPHSW